MSYSKQFYMGPFLKVMNPTKESTSDVPGSCCPNQECVKSKTVLIAPRSIGQSYCSSCGSKHINTTAKIKVTTNIDVYGTCEKLFNNGDMFSGHLRRGGCQVIIPNNNKILSYNEDDFDDGEIFSFTRTHIFNFDNEEWQILIDELQSQGFQLEKDIGIIHYVY